MLRHVQCTFPKLSGLFVLAAACSLAACGGSVGDSVTGTPLSVAPVDAESGLDLEAAFEDFGEAQPGDLFENEDGTLSLSGNCRRKVLVCHKGRRNIWVSRRAYRHHRRHGDTRGRCQAPPTASCPCFTAGDVASAADNCSSSVVASCAMGDPYYLLLSCDPGGNVPPGVLGIYLSQTGNGGSCSRDDVNGTVTQNGLTATEYDACVDVITGSGYCS